MTATMSVRDVADIFSNTMLFKSQDGLHNTIEVTEHDDGARVEVNGSHRTTKAHMLIIVSHEDGIFLVKVHFFDKHHGFQAALVTFSATPELTRTTAEFGDKEILHLNGWG